MATQNKKILTPYKSNQFDIIITIMISNIILLVIKYINNIKFYYIYTNKKFSY